MAQYKISGVWKDENEVITHYAFHKVLSSGITRARKRPKAEAIELLEDSANTAITWEWNYLTSDWKDGQSVQVVQGVRGKYLRSNADSSRTDNLAHLIDYDWIAPA